MLSPTLHRKNTSNDALFGEISIEVGIQVRGVGGSGLGGSVGVSLLLRVAALASAVTIVPVTISTTVVLLASLLVAVAAAVLLLAVLLGERLAQSTCGLLVISVIAEQEVRTFFHTSATALGLACRLVCVLRGERLNNGTGTIVVTVASVKRLHEFRLATKRFRRATQRDRERRSNTAVAVLRVDGSAEQASSHILLLGLEAVKHRLGGMEFSRLSSNADLHGGSIQRHPLS